MKNLKALFYPNVSFETLFIPHIYREIYLDQIYRDVFDKKAPRSMNIIDIGANIGIVTAYMQPFAKRLYAIEPSSEHFEALKMNKEYNDWDNVEIFKLAIADKDGVMELSKNPGNRTMNSIVLRYKGGAEKVKTMTMVSFFRENGIDEVDFLKLDVEGAEEMILRSEGFKKVADKIKGIEVEFHFPDYQKLVDHMIDLGFTAKQYKSSAVVFLFSR